MCPAESDVLPTSSIHFCKFYILISVSRYPLVTPPKTTSRAQEDCFSSNHCFVGGSHTMCMEDAFRCQRLVSHASSFAPVESCTSGARPPCPPRQHALRAYAPHAHAQRRQHCHARARCDQQSCLCRQSAMLRGCEGYIHGCMRMRITQHAADRRQVAEEQGRRGDVNRGHTANRIWEKVQKAKS